MAVVRRLAGSDELQLHARGLGPAVQGLAGELRAVVGADDSRTFALGPQPLQHPGHALAGQRVIRFQAGTAAVPQVHDRQHPEPPAILQAVAHEVHGPLLVRPGRSGRYHAQMARPLATTLEPQRQPFLPVDALHPLVVHRPAFPAQQDVQPRAAKAPALLGQLPKADTQVRVGVRGQAAPVGPPVELDQTAGPPLGIAVRRDDVAYSLTALGGLGQFFPSTSLSTWMSRA